MRSHTDRTPGRWSRAAGIALWMLTAALAGATPAAGVETLSGRAIRVADGDTFTLRTPEGKDIVVRVAEIDAPELDQPHGRESKRALSRLIQHKTVRIEVETLDANGRTVARPYAADVDVSAELVRGGAAWVYGRYLKDPTLPPLEAEARNARRGIWRLEASQRVPPWEWRHAQARQTQPRAEDPGQRCNIKGNVSGSGERIYHVPGQKHYDETRISQGKGERWFCSEAEARAAGWRKARSG